MILSSTKKLMYSNGYVQEIELNQCSISLMTLQKSKVKSLNRIISKNR